ncbi:hypothetical protein C664_06298 [Thauera sp. 63]|nr:hypothetical protein C664_06298 [Thauera sp. 63]
MARFGGPFFYAITQTLAISAVHSLRTPAIRMLVEKADGRIAAVGALLAGGEPRRLEHKGEIFCMRLLSHRA